MLPHTSDVRATAYVFYRSTYVCGHPSSIRAVACMLPHASDVCYHILVTYVLL
jgi:hypothetical protein